MGLRLRAGRYGRRGPRRKLLGLVTAAVAWSLGVSVPAQELKPPELRIAILGTPDHQVPWSDAALERLKAAGFNEIQINIAWGSRPFGEPLNLADVITVPGEQDLPGAARWRAELRRRVDMAHRHGLRTLFHFGSPRADYDPYSGRDTAGPAPSGSYHIDDKTSKSWYDILNPNTREHEFALLREFRRIYPDVEDILVYSYDQHAWETPEFQYTQYSYGVPLAERLPQYLSGLHKIWTEGRNGQGRMWWEPWELSAGQVYAILPRLPRTDFGLIVHSNIAEAQLVLPVDVWLRNTARICGQLGIPVVVESFFTSSSEETEPLQIPAPQLVDEQYLAFTRTPGVVGIKEYFGINTDVPDVDLDVLRMRSAHPSAPTSELLSEATERFGPARDQVLAYLELLTSALRMYPWDASWLARQIGRASIDHGWRGATIKGPTFSTPSWQSTRRARFMMNDSSQPHFWMLEDVQLRCSLTADLLDEAKKIYERADGFASSSEAKGYFTDVQRDMDVLRRVSRSYALHLRETNVASMLRGDLAAGRPMTPALLEEFGKLLEADVANQGNQGRVLEMRALFQKNPVRFIRSHLLLPSKPSDLNRAPERGYFSLTTR